MNLLRIALIALAFASLAAAQTSNPPDVDVSAVISGYSPSTPQGYTNYDADFTADGRLAVAMVEQSTSGLPRTDKLVIALHDPSTGATRFLGAFIALNWAIEHVSLAVPPKIYSIPGSMGLHDHLRNRVYVAIGAEAPVYNSYSAGLYTQRVRAVRVISVSFTDPQAPMTLDICSPPNVGLFAVPMGAEPPRPEAQVYERGSGYDVECAFIDPRNLDAQMGHVMMVRSIDFGATMQNAFYVTGPGSAATGALRSSKFARPSLAFDISSGRSVIAMGDTTTRCVRVAYAPAGFTTFTQVMATGVPTLPDRYHSPRIAARAGLINVTYRVGSPTNATPQPVDWCSVNYAGARVQLPRLTARSTSHADIEVRGSDAYVAILERENTSPYTRDVAVRYSLKRNDVFQTPQPRRFDDGASNWSLLGRPAVSAVTPEGASPTRIGALNLFTLDTFAMVLRGHVKLEL